MPAEFQRVFLALWPPSAVATGLHRLGDSKLGQALLAADLHLTLAFIGEADLAGLERLRQVAAGLSLPRTRLRFNCLQYWPHNHILWAAPEAWPTELAAFVTRLHGALNEAGFRCEAREFVPHVTLLRKAAAGQEGALAQAIEWDVAGWTLAASASIAGRRYRRLAEWDATWRCRTAFCPPCRPAAS